MCGPKSLDLLDLFDLLCHERVPIPGQETAAGARVIRQKMAAGARVIRDSVISVILAGVSATSRK